MLQRGALLGQVEREEVNVSLSVASGNTLMLLWYLSNAACCTANASHSEASLLTWRLLVWLVLARLASSLLLSCLLSISFWCSASMVSLAWL